MEQFPLTLGAPAFESLIWVAFLVFMFIGWVINLAKGVKPPGQGKPQPRPRTPADQARRDAVQQEIDKFLKQSRDGAFGPTQPGGAEPAAKPPQPASASAGGGMRTSQEIWEEQTGRRPPRQKNNKKAAKPPRPQKPVSPPLPVAPVPAPAARLTSQKANAPAPISTLSSNLVKLPESQIGVRGKAFLAADTGDSRTFEALQSRRTRSAQGLVASLMHRQGTREALLLSEILSPPLSRRTRK